MLDPGLLVTIRSDLLLGILTGSTVDLVEEVEALTIVPRRSLDGEVLVNQEHIPDSELRENVSRALQDVCNVYTHFAHLLHGHKITLPYSAPSLLLLLAPTGGSPSKRILWGDAFQTQEPSLVLCASRLSQCNGECSEFQESRKTVHGRVEHLRSDQRGH